MLTVVKEDSGANGVIGAIGATFDDFWLLYPRRVARKDALRAWSKLTPAEQMAAVVAMVDWRRVWAQRDREYLPHAATWLNGARWEDELPETDGPMSGAHVAAALPAAGERVAMPDKVRAVLAKLRAGRG